VSVEYERVSRGWAAWDPERPEVCGSGATLGEAVADYEAHPLYRPAPAHEEESE